ncbi:MAG: DUF58 domain-containing protein [Candidatus Woesearchaeota archaeon]
MELLIDIDAQVKRVSPLTKKGFFGNLVGEYRSAFRGRGLEFTTFRNYDVGDDAIHIDWKATLRSQGPLVRVFEEERDLKVYFLFDTSNSMLFSSHEKLKAEFAAEFMAALMYGVLHAEDAVGLVMFSDTIKTFIPASIGDTQFFNLSRALTDTRNYGGTKNYEKLINFCMGSLPKTSILFMVSDFIGLPEDYEHHFEPMNQKYESVAFMIRDPVDDELPGEGEAYLLDPFSDDEIEVEAPLVRGRYAEHVLAFKQQVTDTYRKSRDDVLILRSDEDYLPVLIRYLVRRKNRLMHGGKS